MFHNSFTEVKEMEKRKMLVTEGLNQLKLLDSRIRNGIAKANFICASKLSDKNARPGVSKEDFINDAKADYQSINDLIAEREKIKAAIIESNAVTEIEIAGEKMTVAKAIDRKESILYLTDLLCHMKNQYDTSIATVNSKNVDMEKTIDSMLAQAYGRDQKEKVDENTYNAIAAPIKLNRETGLVDPLNLKDEIDKLEAYVEDFLSNIDAKLQISNCITFIEV